MDGGDLTVVKDGTHYGNPMLGLGLVHATQGNPRAEEQARIGHNLAIGGLVLDIAGLGGEVGGLATLPHGDRAERPSALSVGLLLGSLVALSVGTVLLLNSQPHIYDAINIYNDGVDSSPH